MSQKIIAPLLTILISIPVSAGVTYKWLPDCDTSTAPIRATFTLTCISNANPKSDEEPEDWIRLCKKMADETYCPMAMFKSHWDGAIQKIVKADQSIDPSD